ncbi:MAG: exosortase-associated EpsI family protein [Phycisphaerales bacterium]|nr:exosortase-associated EpsI family protein [Phycisphaerales bacterium]
MSTAAAHPGARKTLSIALLVLMLASAAGISAYIRIKDVHLQKIPIYPENNRQVSTIPSLTPSWRQVGSDEIMGVELVETLGTDNYLSRHYVLTRDADPKKPIVVDLHLAYYTGMIDTVPHVPERCFVGGGLQQSESSRVIDLPMDTSSWRVDQTVPAEFGGVDGAIYSVRLSNDPSMSDAPGRRIRLPRGVTPEKPFQFRASEFINPGRGNVYAGYFFIANGGTKANANDVRQLAFNLEDDYAYYLKVQVSASGLESFDEFAHYSGDLVGELIGEIMRCVPDWISVQQGTYPPDNPRGNDGQE